MNDTLRPAVLEDAPECGRICYEAFQAIADAHNFRNYWQSPEVAMGMFDWFIKHPGWYGVVAEREGKVIGSNFMDESGARCASDSDRLSQPFALPPHEPRLPDA